MNRIILRIIVALLMGASLSATAAPDRKPKKDRRERVSVVIDDNQSGKQTHAAAAMREVPLTNAASQLRGRWTVTDVRRKPLKNGARVTMELDPSSGLLIGDMGCNRVNAQMKVTGTKVTFNNVVTTHHSCADASMEQSIVKALGDSHSLRLETNGIVTMLHTVSSHGSNVLSLRRVELADIDGMWQLVSLYGEAVEPAASTRMVLDATAGLFHARGQNIINGVTRVDAARERSLQFEDLHATTDDVELSTTESRLMLALEEVTDYAIDGQGVMSLRDEEGRVVATLKRL